MLVFLCFVVHYAPSLSNNLSGSVRGMNGCGYSYFQDQTSLSSDANTLERIALIFARGDLTSRGILATTMLGDNNEIIYWKLIIMFRAKEGCILSETPCCNLLVVGSDIFGNTTIEVMIR